MGIDPSSWIAYRLFGVSLLDWLTAIGTGAAIFGALTLAKHLLLKRLRPLAERTKNRLDDLLVETILRTKSPFLFALSVLPVVSLLDLGTAAGRAVDAAIVVLLWVQVGLWANGAISFWQQVLKAKRQAGEIESDAMVTVVGIAGRALAWTLIGLLIIQNLGFDVTALLAGLGVGGIAIALAVQNVLSDLLASLSIALDKPFVVGDFIQIDALSGTVEHIGLKTTRVRSLSGEMLVLSNGELLKSRIHNFKQLQERRIAFTIGVTYQTDPSRLERIPALIREIIEPIPGARFDRTYFRSFGDSALLFEVVYFVLDPKIETFLDINQRINLEIFRRFAQEGIEFAYPTQTLHLEGQIGGAPRG